MSESIVIEPDIFFTSHYSSERTKIYIPARMLILQIVYFAPMVAGLTHYAVNDGDVNKLSHQMRMHS